MSFLPVVERELRVTARNSRFFWGRMGTSFVATAIIAWLWLMNADGRSTSAQVAKLSFEVLAWMAFSFSAILGVFLTADCISEEKREGTLGLLFLTNLKGYDVALGKLAAISVRALFNLLSIFPVLTIPLLLGGITGEEVFRVALALLVTLIFSLAAGLLISTVSRNDRRAQFGALALVAAFTLVVPTAVAMLQRELRAPVADGLFWISPGFAFTAAFEDKYAKHQQDFWGSIALVHAISWIIFFLASIIVRRIWQDRPSISDRSGFLTRLRHWKHGAPAVRKQYRESLLGVNAYYWLAARDRFKPYYVLLFLMGCAGLWFVLWMKNRHDMLEQETFFIASVLLHSAMRVWLAAEAGRQFSEDRRTSALELTLSTPIPVRDILEGQFLGLLRQFAIPVGGILLFDLVGMILGARVRLGSENEAVLMWIATMIVFVVDLVTIATLGMWFGLVVRSSSRAIAKNLFYVIGIPWLILIGFITYISLVPMHRSSIESPEFLIGTYFLVNIVTDLVLYLQASGSLTHRFREAVIQGARDTVVQKA